MYAPSPLTLTPSRTDVGEGIAGLVGGWRGEQHGTRPFVRCLVAEQMASLAEDEVASARVDFDCPARGRKRHNHPRVRRPELYRALVGGRRRWCADDLQRLQQEGADLRELLYGRPVDLPLFHD